MNKEKPLTIKQENFCQAYVRLGNKSEAYCEAYHHTGAKTLYASNMAARLAKNPAIASRINEIQAEAQERNKITLDELLQALASMVRFDIADLYDANGTLKSFTALSKEARQMIQQIESSEVYARSEKGQREVVGAVKKVKTYSRIDALEKLMKHLGGYEKDNQQSKSTQNIVFLNLGDGEPEPS